MSEDLFKEPVAAERPERDPLAAHVDSIRAIARGSWIYQLHGADVSVVSRSLQSVDRAKRRRGERSGRWDRQRVCR